MFLRAAAIAQTGHRKSGGNLSWRALEQAIGRYHGLTGVLSLGTVSAASSVRSRYERLGAKRPGALYFWCRLMRQQTADRGSVVTTAASQRYRVADIAHPVGCTLVGFVFRLTDRATSRRHT